jgi:hypothetical protein
MGMDIGEETPIMDREERPTMEETMSKLKRVVGLASGSRI